MAFSLSLQTFHFGNQSVPLYVPDEAEVKGAYEEGKLTSPFWTQVWPSAQALATFLAKNKQYTKNKSVLELGAGLGLPSLVAAQHAASVLCTDYISEAVEVAQRSADHLSLSNFRTAVIDWLHLPKDLNADVVLLSDVNYEPEVFGALKEMIGVFLAKHTTILLATPQRLMAKTFVDQLLPFCTYQEEVTIWKEGKQHSISVLVLANNKSG